MPSSRSMRLLAAGAGLLAQALGLHLQGPGNGTDLLTSGGEDVEEIFMDEHRPKLFFTAGLEGSGIRVFQELWKRSFEYDDDPTQHVLKFTENWTCGHNWPFPEYNTMKERMKTIKVNDMWALPFQATYPSCGVRTHEHENRLDWFHPDLEWLVRAARDADADLHVIFMRRSVEDALKYACENQRYEISCALEAESLIANADILLYQLREIVQYDSTKLSCFNYTSDAEVQEAVRAVFHDPLPNIDHEFARRNISHLPPFTDADLEDQLAMVHNKTAELDEMCASLSQFRVEDLRRFVEIGHGSTGRLHIQTPPR